MMKLKVVIVFVQILTIVTIAVLTPPTLLVWAEGNQSNQGMNQPAMLIAPNPEFKIKIYSKPDISKRQIGYGLGGDQVTVVEQVGSNTGSIWNYVRFDKDSHLDGWVQENFVRLSGSNKVSDWTSETDSSKTQNQYNQNTNFSWSNSDFDKHQNVEPTNQRFYQNSQQSYQDNQRQSNY